MESRNFSLLEIIGTSVRLALKNWQISVVFMLMGAALSIPAYVLSWLVRYLPDTWDFGFFLFTALIGLGILGLFVGLINVAFEILDKGIGSTFKLFTSFHLLARFLGASVLFYLPIIVVLFVVNWLGVFFYGNWLRYIFGAIPLFFALMVVFSVIFRLCLYPYYIVAKDAGMLESLEKSFHTTRGQGFKMVIVYVIVAVVSLIPIIGIMAGQLVWVSVYRKLVSKFS